MNLWPRTPKQRLFVALLLAAFFTLNLGFGAALRKIRQAVGLWFNIWQHKGAKVSPELRRARLECCRKCVFYFDKLDTCGTPLIKEMRQYGCWCHCPTKSQYVDAQCWLDEAVFYDLDLMPFIGHSWISAGLSVANKDDTLGQYERTYRSRSYLGDLDADAGTARTDSPRRCGCGGASTPAASPAPPDQEAGH